MEPTGELSQLAEGRCELRTPSLEQVARGGVGCELCLGQRQREQQRDQALLRPVMEVALEPAPFGIAGLHETGTRRTQIREARTKIGLKAPVLEGQTRRGTHGLNEFGMVPKRGI